MENLRITLRWFLPLFLFATVITIIYMLGGIPAIILAVCSVVIGSVTTIALLLFIGLMDWVYAPKD